MRLDITPGTVCKKGWLDSSPPTFADILETRKALARNGWWLVGIGLPAFVGLLFGNNKVMTVSICVLLFVCPVFLRKAVPFGAHWIKRLTPDECEEVAGIMAKSPVVKLYVDRVNMQVRELVGFELAAFRAQVSRDRAERQLAAVYGAPVGTEDKFDQSESTT